MHKQLLNYHQKLKQSLADVSQKTTKPNILLLGASGAGKSSLVNAVFGKPLAEIGEGKPITQHYTKYSSSTSPVVIYDSKYVYKTKKNILHCDVCVVLYFCLCVLYFNIIILFY